ncbi:MAG TPA: hypothetical protein VMK13_13580 [Streptosporangiaceae bacterium]|nr:hypothetical protein [Streptosporangiaceae bacterium]
MTRCKLSAGTVRACKRQAAAYAGWLAGHAGAHGDALADLGGAEGAVTARKRHMITLMYQQAGIRIAIKRVRIPRPGEPGALTPALCVRRRRGHPSSFCPTR